MKKLFLITCIIITTFSQVSGQTIGLSGNYINDIIFEEGNYKLGGGVSLGLEIPNSKHSIELEYNYYYRKNIYGSADLLELSQRFLNLNYSYDFFSTNQFHLKSGIDFGAVLIAGEKMRTRRDSYFDYYAYNVNIPLILNYELFNGKIILEFKTEGGYYFDKMPLDYRLERYNYTDGPKHHPFFTTQVGIKYRLKP